MTVGDRLHVLHLVGMANQEVFGAVCRGVARSVAERFNRNLKAQAIHGRVFQNFQDVGQTVRAFVKVHKEHGRVNTHGITSSDRMRRFWFREAA